MTGKVFIKNINGYPLRELFKGEEVTIAANDFWRDKGGKKKELDIYEANDFKGQYHPVACDMSGKMINDPKHYKMLELIPVDASEVKTESDSPAYRCMAKDCKHVSPSAEELEAHTKTRHSNIDRLILPEEDAKLPKKAKA